MPIDREKFAACMVLLGERFNRPVGKPMMRAYYRILNPHFADDNHFAATFERAFAQAKFFPSPEEILAAGETPADEDELTALHLLQESREFTQYSSGHGQVNRREQFRTAKPDAARMIAALEQTIGIHWTCHAIHVGLAGGADQFNQGNSLRITEAVVRAAVSAIRYNRRLDRLMLADGGGPRPINFLTAGDPDEAH